MNSTFRRSLHCLIVFLAALMVCAPSAHADSASEAPKHKPNTKLWKSEKEQGEAAYKEHHFAEAESHFQAALAEAENFDAKDYRLAESVTELGDFYARAGRFAEAEPLLQRAVGIRRGDPNPLTEAYVQFLLGFTCQQLRHYDDAEKAYLRAQELYSRKYGPDHPLAVRCMFYLGSLYDDQKDYAKAEPLLKRCLTLFEHPATRTINRSPGDPAVNFGTEVWIGQFRPDFAYALETLVRLGSLYAQQDRAADSAASFKDALKMIDDRLAKNDPAAPVALNQISAIYLGRKDYAGAELFVQRYAAFMEKTKGPDDPVTQAAQAKLALVYEREGKAEEAEGVYKQQIAVYEKKFGPKNKALVKPLNDYAALLRKSKRDSEADALEARAKAIQEEAGK